MPSIQRQRLQPIVDLGDEDPLYTRNLNNGPPDRRRVSLRWLSGSVLTGIFSAGLVGGALQAAIGLDDYSIVRPALAHASAPMDNGAIAPKGDRYRPAPESQLTRRVIQISTVTRTDDRDVVRVRPFAHVHTGLAAPASADVAAWVPAFNPAEVYADNGSDDAAPAVDAVAASDSIYGAEVDGEVTIKVADFPVEGPYDETAELTPSEVEQSVRLASPFLADGAVELASLPYVDPARFDIPNADPNALPSLTVAITPENLSMIEKTEAQPEATGIAEKVVAVTEGASLKRMLEDQGATADAAAQIKSALVANFSFDFRAGQTLRLGLAPDASGASRPVRVSLYDGGAHLATVALSDTGTYVKAAAPALDDELFVAENDASTPGGALPTIHDGLWGTGLSLGMSPELISSLVHIFSYDVDYQARLSPSDALEVIYSAGGDGESEGAEILYAALTLGTAAHRFYRFRDTSDGSVDYYDEEGKSAQKFLVRKPVAQGRFSSAFGMRRHPILKRYRLHSGVDWAAPVGTPILAAGDGVIETIGTRSGYGRSVMLKHLNGYETTYNHMSGYAKALTAGDHVRQGQVIGFVGSSGLSTGPHLHFEVLVNKRFVDPMKIRLPRGRELGGPELASFEKERRRIDDLLSRDDSRVANAAAATN